MIVTVDTNILIWGVRAVSKPEQAGMIPRAARFLEWLDENNHTLVLTSHVVSEYLIGATASQRNLEYAELSSKFMIYSYDSNSAAVAADLRSDRDFIRSLGDDARKTRHCIKGDVIIVATAHAHGITRVYTHDGGITALANRVGMSAADLPTIEAMYPLQSPPTGGHPKTKEQFLFSEESEDQV